MKDDEKRLLGASQDAGEVVASEGISSGRFEALQQKWRNLGWLDDHGKLTAKCMVKPRGTQPEIAKAKPPEKPIVFEAPVPLEVVVESVESVVDELNEPMVNGEPEEESSDEEPEEVAGTDGDEDEPTEPSEEVSEGDEEEPED